METRIAIIGAGNVGSALAERLTASGYSVRLGVKPASDVAALLRRCAGKAVAVPVAEAAEGCEVIFLCVPATVAVAAAKAAGNLRRKVLIDCTNPVVWKDGPVLAPPPEGSVAAALAAALPEARVVKGFNAFGAEIHRDPNVGGAPAEVFLAGDDGMALERAGEVAVRAGFAPIVVGPLRNAALLEALAVLWIHLALVAGQGRQFAFGLVRR
jgi:8-hydroxy-5-deazaflavin:NADPH oxidoreductase